MIYLLDTNILIYLIRENPIVKAELTNLDIFEPENTVSISIASYGEIHEDIAYISYDKTRKIFVLRQFHIEGFVNQYKLDSLSADSKTIVFISENIENIPTGWRAKETYQLTSDTEFIEIFELAEPNKGFEIYSKATFKKIK